MHRIGPLILICATAIWGQEASRPAPGAAQSQRIRHLAESLMAPCCWAEPVSIHRSEIAMQMRMEIERAVRDGATDGEILQRYKAAYGVRILVEPEGAFRVWAYLIPALAAAFGLGVVMWMIRRLRRDGPAEQPAL